MLHMRRREKSKEYYSEVATGKEVRFFVTYNRISIECICKKTEQEELQRKGNEQRDREGDIYTQIERQQTETLKNKRKIKKRC
jgi:hypothetical protein